MAKRQKIWVSPNQKNGWSVKAQGGNRAIKNFDKKSDAIAKAKEVAKNADLGQLIIQKQNGVIQTEYTYRKDPEKYSG